MARVHWSVKRRGALKKGDVLGSYTDDQGELVVCVRRPNERKADEVSVDEDMAEPPDEFDVDAQKKARAKRVR